MAPSSPTSALAAARRARKGTLTVSYAGDATHDPAKVNRRIKLRSAISSAYGRAGMSLPAAECWGISHFATLDRVKMSKRRPT